MRLIINHLIQNDINPESVRFTMPNGKNAKIIKISEGYSWKING